MTGIGLTIGFFLCVMAGIVACGYWIMRAKTRAPAIGLSLTEPDLTASRAAMLDVFRSIGEQFPSARREENKYRKQLSRLGYRWPPAVPVFYGIKCASALLISTLVGLAMLISHPERSAVVPAICGAGLGALLPDRILAARIRARAKRLRSGIPPALDLMVLGLEAGQSLDQTLEYTSRALKTTHPDLSSELGQVYLELRARDARMEALRNLAERNAEPELRKLSNLLIDSDRFGTSLGPSLRTHAKYLRVRFRQQAQEAARKIGVKLIFPIFLLIFPSVLLVTLGPACMMMYQQMQTLMKGPT
ncbi:MAG: type II secretion system F family protein [Bryobacteraceae bacterium]